MSTFLTDIETATVKRLQSALPQKTIQIEPYPANFRQFLDNFRAANAAILVQYAGRKRRTTSHYTTDEGATQSSGFDKLTFELTFVARKVSGEFTAVIPLLEAADMALAGKNLTKTVKTSDPEHPTIEEPLGTRLFLTDDRFEAYLEKYALWIYTQIYETDECGWIRDEEPQGVITEFTLKSIAGIEEIIPDPNEEETNP